MYEIQFSKVKKLLIFATVKKYKLSNHVNSMVRQS